MLRSLKGKGSLKQPSQQMWDEGCGFPMDQTWPLHNSPSVQSSQMGSMANITGQRQGRLHAIMQGLAP